VHTWQYEKNCYTYIKDICKDKTATNKSYKIMQCAVLMYLLQHIWQIMMHSSTGIRNNDHELAANKYN